MSDRLVIFGNGEIAELAKMYFDTDSDYEVCGFVVDDAYIESDEFCGLPIVALSQIESNYPSDEFLIHVALSYTKLNEVRRDKFNQLKGLGYQFASYVSSHCTIVGEVEIGENCFILENQTLQHGVKLGNNVMLWSGNHIGHGSVISDHVYLASHIVISGHCSIGERTFIGVNATVKDFTNIGEACFIGMGANVAKDVVAGAVVVAAQSQYIDAEDRKAKMLKKKYFGAM